MSEIIKINSSLVKADGVRFCEYGEVLNQTIQSIDTEIDEIISKGLSGRANNALCNKYYEIRESANRFSAMISALGNEIQNTAVRNTNVDEDTAQSINNIDTLQ